MGPRFALTAVSRNGGRTLVPRLRKSLPVISPDDGQHLLHAGTARDAGRMIARLVLDPKCLGRDYTVASPAAITYDGYLGLFAEALDVNPRIVHIPTEKIYEFSDYTIYEENLLYDLTSHDVSFSVDRGFAMISPILSMSGRSGRLSGSISPSRTRAAVLPVTRTALNPLHWRGG